MNAITSMFAVCIQFCYQVTKNYVLAITLFTLLTKVLMFPVSMWTHRNGIKMVELMPEINRLKIDYYGDNATVAEKTQKMYKRVGYHPFAGMVPMIIQLFLLAGVTGAIRRLLEGTDSLLSVYPYQMGGATLLMPLGAGLAALALSMAQNYLNPLQREQSFFQQLSTSSFSVGISLALGAFVPIGVGVYWICSNLFSIVQQILLNMVIPAKKYVDYEALVKSRKELIEINSLSSNVSKEDRKREKADYKRFFNVANKHLVFYSERNGFYKYFKDLIEWLLAHSNVIIHYVTSDPKDKIFEIAKEQDRIKTYYIGDRRIITLMMKMDADMVVMTTPDLDNFHIKRSYVRKDVEYVYVPHGFGSPNTELRTGALDHFDTLFSIGEQATREMRALEAVYNLPPKDIVEFGVPLMDRMLVDYQNMEIMEDQDSRKRILIAPSWQQDNIIDICLEDILKGLLGKGYRLVVRPHPQYMRHGATKIADLKRKYADYASELEFETDFSSTSSVYRADLLITDWSGVGYEYCFTTCRPVLFIHTPMKIMNPEYKKINMVSISERLRNKVGRDLPLDQIDQIGEEVARLFAQAKLYQSEIERISREERYNFGTAAEHGGREILTRLLQKHKTK